jgi:hypothetical protein
MQSDTVRKQLERLHAIILEEREAAKSLDTVRLGDLTREKEELLGELAAVAEDGEVELDIRELAEKVGRENRRNAYFFSSALEWVQERLDFMNGRLSWASYSGLGTEVQNRFGGNLLSGKV